MQNTPIVFLLVVLTFSVVVLAGLQVSFASAWGNGGYSADITHPDYGTHDWVAQHALDWLPQQEKQVLADNLATYIFGTELPDNKNTPGGVGDTTKHHIYFTADGFLNDNASAVRADAEYINAKQAYADGNLTDVALHLGMVTHYIADMSVFGHLMGASTSWGAETHHSDYEDYVGGRTSTYASAAFDGYLSFDGALTSTPAYDAAVALARDTTFAAGVNCTWMDQHYNWSSSVFKNRAGASLNLAANAVADVLHMFYAETQAAASPSAAQTATLSPQPKDTSVSPELPVTVVAVVLGAAVLSTALFMKKRSRKKSSE
jgi:hypothetical protein